MTHARRENHTLHSTEKNVGMRRKPSEDPVRKMHRHLTWALSVSTGALIVNAIVVVTML